MKTKSEFIANRLHEVLLSGHWIANTNYKHILESITWQQAINKIGQLNTIAQLTFHIQYYLKGINDVFEGKTFTIKDKYSFDMPALQSEVDWQLLVQGFLNNSEKIISHVGQLPEEKWEAIFVEEKYGSYLRNIEGIIEHCYYHLGQISLIKKMQLQNPY